MQRKWRIILALAVLIALLICGAALADESGDCGDNVSWTLNTSTGALTISGSGPMTNYSRPSSVPWYSYRESITSVSIGSGVTSIGSFAFNNCIDLAGITIPNGVTSIGNSAFSSCSGMTWVTIPGSVTNIGNAAFMSCTSLISVTIPYSVTGIGNNAFYNCGNLTSTTILNPETVIGSGAFANCDDSLDIHGWTSSTAQTYASENGISFDGWESSGSCGNNVAYTYSPATGNLTISGTGAMANYEYAGSPWCDYSVDILSVTIGDGVTSIGSDAFYGCIRLSDISIPNSVASIGSFALGACTGLTDVTILNPDCVIGDSEYDVFDGCSPALTLHGYTGSTTETYAAAAGITFNSLNSGFCGDNVTWTFISSTGNLIIRGSGAMADYSGPSASVPWQSFRGDILSITIEDGVTNIGGYAFSDCKSLTSVTIPNSVKSIDWLAFYYCTSLTGVTIPDSVTSIGNSAFSVCKSLTSVTIPNSVTRIDGSAFAYCNTLTSVVIPESLTSISNSVFKRCPSLTNVTIPDSVTSIGNAAFSYCTSLTNVTIPDSVISIEYQAFLGCTNLTYVTVNNPTCTIGNGSDDVFKNCAAGFILRGWLGSTAEAYAIENDIAFEFLDNITGSCGENLSWSLNTDLGVLTISGTGLMTNYANSIDVPWYGYLNSITSVSIGSGVTSIGTTAFYNCTNLISVTIPDSVTRIGPSTFSYCANLTGMTIPNSVTSIGLYAFRGCSSLTSITIPNSVASIDYMAFFGCTNLTGVTILNPDCVIGDSDYDVFQGCADGFTLYGYIGSTAEAYAANTRNPCNFIALDTPAPDFILPVNLTTIGAEAFQGIAAKAVLIPATVTAIEGNPFAGSQLQYIYGTAGTAAETFANANGYTFVPINDAPMAGH